MAPPVTIVWWEGFSLFMVEAMITLGLMKSLCWRDAICRASTICDRL